MQTITVLPLSFHVERAEQGKTVHRKYYRQRKASSFHSSWDYPFSFNTDYRCVLGSTQTCWSTLSSQSCAALRISSKQGMRQENKE